MRQAVKNLCGQGEKQPLWDKLLAHKIARILARTPLTPNMITSLCLVLVIISGLLFSIGRPAYHDIAALIFMITRFLDHLDGELARIKRSESKVGHYYDWFTDTFSYSFLFICLAIGFSYRLDIPAVILVVIAVFACVLNSLAGLYVESLQDNGVDTGFPSFAGVSIEDGVYLIGPICWAGWLYPFFILCLVGAIMYTIFSLFHFIVMTR